MKDRTKNSVKPFWSWNDKLERAELEKQIEIMKANGIEGFFMHARGGLRTEYMSDEWFNMIEACLDKADELGMQAWAYDENGWPSGFGDGVVPKGKLENQQKTLDFVVFNGTNMPEEDKIIARFNKNGDGYILTDKIENGTYIYFYKVNPYYIDVFNKDTIAEFLKVTHNKYYERFKDRFGTSLKGFFTDEPQYESFPWSHIFPEEFKNTYGYSLIENLPALSFDTEASVQVRNDFYTMVARLIRESFIKQMYDWCSEHNCKLTGHMMCEDNLYVQVMKTGGVMPCYEYFHEPGIDHLGRCINTPILPKQLGSVASQLGRKTLTETFALCGWDVSLNELKWIAQWQYLNGVTSLCPHLEGYSLRGIRKRDYPASLFSQLPWFDEAYSDFADYFTSLGALLDSGKDITPVLMIHPIQSAYVLEALQNEDKIKQYSNDFDIITSEISGQHILHHYGDETIMENHGRVDNDKIVVGNCSYNTVLLPNIINLKANTVKLLLEFIENGGKVYALERLPEFENGRVTDGIKKLAENLIVCKDVAEFKSFYTDAVPVDLKGSEPDSVHLNIKEMPDGRKLLYMINNTKKEQSVKIEIKGEFALYIYDVLAEKEERLTTVVSDGKTYAEYCFAEYGSAVIYLYDCKDSYTAKAVDTEVIALDKMFDITAKTDNSITLDKCIYRIDGGEWQEEMATINLFNEVLALQKSCDVEMQYSLQVDEQFDFSSVNLCMEDPEKFEIKINGNPYNFSDNGQFVDHAFRKSNIGSCLKMGVNTINLSCRFTQTPELYYAKFTPGVHESELNKLTYDTELESIYITGDFGVLMQENFEYGKRRCLHGGKNFSLVKPKNRVDITDITPQNFWFFSGKLELSQKVRVSRTDDRRYLVSFKNLNAPAALIYINGGFAGKMEFAPFSVDVTDYVTDGENEIKIVMLSGNRNLLGPHHRPYGESYFVGPDTFSDKTGWADDPNLPPWTDNYSFVIFGAEL